MLEGFKTGDRVRLTPTGAVNLGVTLTDGGTGTVVRDWDNDQQAKTSRVVFDRADGSQTGPWLVYATEIELVDEKKGDDNDPVKPNHYKFGDVEVMDIVKHLPFLEGNIIKYVARAKRKGNELEDLHKARHYLDLAIQEAEKNK